MLRVPLEMGEEVLILLARLEERLTRKILQDSIENRMYFNKDKIFQITNRKNIDGKIFYWVKSTKTETNIKKRFQREKLFSLSGNFT